MVVAMPVIVIPLLVVLVGLIRVLLVILRFLMRFLIVLIAAIVIVLPLLVSMAMAMAVMPIIALLLALVWTLLTLVLSLAIFSLGLFGFAFWNDAKRRKFFLFDLLHNDAFFEGAVLHGDDVFEIVGLEIIARGVGQANGFGDDVERIDGIISVWRMDDGAIFGECLFRFRVGVVFKRQAADKLAAMARKLRNIQGEHLVLGSADGDGFKTIEERRTAKRKAADADAPGHLRAVSWRDLPELYAAIEQWIDLMKQFTEINAFLRRGVGDGDVGAV